MKPRALPARKGSYLGVRDAFDGHVGVHGTLWGSNDKYQLPIRVGDTAKVQAAMCILPVYLLPPCGLPLGSTAYEEREQDVERCVSSAFKHSH